MALLDVTLIYSGQMADNNEIDLYDVSQALLGFQRSLALTTHLILNDEIITQAPSLRGAQILAGSAQDGSWKLTATIIAALYTAGTAPKDTPIGHLISSAYDYVVSETLGFHVDYNKTIGQSYEELKRKKIDNIKELPATRFDSLIEKCQTAIREMHRPIVKSETANQAKIITTLESQSKRFKYPLTRETYEYIAYTEQSLSTFNFVGWVSSYNINTFKGRIYLPKYRRPIPFELMEDARTGRAISAITRSLSSNAADRMKDEGSILFRAFENVSRTGTLKSLNIVEVEG